MFQIWRQRAEQTLEKIADDILTQEKAENDARALFDADPQIEIVAVLFDCFQSVEAALVIRDRADREVRSFKAIKAA